MKKRILCKGGCGDYANYKGWCRIKWKYEPFSIHYWDSERRIMANTIPDFYIPSKNIIIEVKGYQFYPQRVKDKIKSLKNKGYKVILLQEKEMYKIEKKRINFLINYIND